MKKVWILFYFLGSFLPMGAQQPASKATGNKLSQFVKKRLEWAKKNMSAKYNAAVKKAGQMLSTSPQRKRIRELANQCPACPVEKSNDREYMSCIKKQCPLLAEPLEKAFIAYKEKALKIIVGTILGSQVALFGAIAGAVGLGVYLEGQEADEDEIYIEEYEEEAEDKTPNVMNEPVPKIGIRPLQPTSSKKP